MKKYIVYYSFIIEAQNIDIAEKEAYDIFETNLNADTRVRDIDITVRGISE